MIEHLLDEYNKMQTRTVKYLILVYFKVISSGLLLSGKKLERTHAKKTSRDIGKESESLLVTKPYSVGSNHDAESPHKNEGKILEPF